MPFLLLLIGCPVHKTLIDDVVGSDTAATDTAANDSADYTGGAELPTCLPSDQVGVLGAWLHQLWLVAYGAPAASTPDTAVSFYQLPGVAQAPWFLLNLAAPCDAAHDLDPVCVDGVCSQVDCTGAGGGWVNHIENDPDAVGDELTDFDGWSVDRGRLPLSWDDAGTSLALEIDVRGLTAPDGSDWAVSGAATLDGDLTLSSDFPNLTPQGPVHVAVASGAGEVSVAGAVIGTWDGTNLTSTDCLDP